jgi:hypothetical protein
MPHYPQAQSVVDLVVCGAGQRPAFLRDGSDEAGGAQRSSFTD